MPTVTSDVLDIAYMRGGSDNGFPLLLLHGWPDDPRGWAGITPSLEAAGYRWIAPWLRGFGPTGFRSSATLRDGSAAALAQDALDLADALGLGRFAVVGHDWGGRAAYALAALAPERVAAIAALAIAYAPRGRFTVPAFDQCARWWYQWLMTSEAGGRKVAEDPIGFARRQWDTWSPPGWFDEAGFATTAESFLNPDWVAITLHGYRHRWQAEPLDERYTSQRSRIDATEQLIVPTLMIQGGDDRCDPPAESEDQERYFDAGYARRVLYGVGHFPAREAPNQVARSVLAHLAALAL
jgi:pimeloyl-ACP methyl ester carboxylesterase